MLDQISQFLDSINTPAVWAGAAIVFELVGRVIKTTKPMSFLRVVGRGFQKVSDVLEKGAQFIDKAVPDVTKLPPA